MGLDIYLYRYENREETATLEKQYNDFSNNLWKDAGEWDSIPDDKKDDLRAKEESFAASLGLEKYGEDPRKQSIELPSEKYPDHYFKIGYFRSSYNGGGINRVLSNLGLPSLYELFNRTDDDEYVWQPDWQMSLIRVKECREQLLQKTNVRCFTLDDFFPDNEIKSEEEAIACFLKEQSPSSGFGEDGYSNKMGYFYPKEPLKVHALIHGQRKALFGDHFKPVTYVVMEGENQWYVQALEIVIETIEYVLAQHDKDKYYLHWSS